MNQRKTRYSIDGFVPNNGDRHVGNRPATSHPPLDARNLKGVRRRRPHHLQQPMLAQTPSVINNEGQKRSNFPEFTTYAGSAQSNGRRERLRAGHRPEEVSAGRSFWRRHNWKKIIKRSAAALAVVLVIVGGWLGWELLHTSSKVLGNGNLIDFLSSTRLKGEDQGRVNVLLAGVSTDDPGHDGANLTDSIMLMSLDTKNHKAQLLSIPRDLWVKIPGYGYSKINAANAYGDNDQFTDPNYPSGGIGLLEKTLSQNLQLPINYYVKIDYSALKDAVNAVGGIEVNIQSDDKRGLYDPNISKHDQGPLRLQNGVQTLDGQTALNLARARGDPCGCGRYAYGFAGSDFERTQHQRQELIALKTKINTPGVITNPLKVGQLFNAIGNHVKSNFKPSEIHRLYDISKEISNNDVQSIGLNDANGKNLLASYTTSDGASALIPAAGVGDFSQIQLYLKKLLSNDQVSRESAMVAVLNGGDITGLASKEGNVLTGKGMEVSAVGDAPTQSQNTIIDQSAGKKPATLAALKQLFGSNVSAVPNKSYPKADFVIILGTSQKAPNGDSSSN